MPPFDLGVLLQMLTYGRPSGSDTEKAFIARYLSPLPGATVDSHGNLHVCIGDNPIILWSCHTDTVHRVPGRYTVSYDGLTVGLSKRAKRQGISCLGADDTAGVFLCRQMILAGVPGHYVFHMGEEIGGIGSDALAAAWPDTLSSIKYAIALDRKGYSDIITAQYGRCASDAFAEALALQLNATGLEYVGSDNGVFTDTANYTGLIGECTNLSVGYFHAHSPEEWLNVEHLRQLLPVLATIDPTALVSEREPGIEDDWRHDYSSYGDWTWLGSSPKPAAKVLAFAGVLECQYCHMPYDGLNSTADEYELFCCADCEAADNYYSMVRRVRTEPSIYLDSDYADVQAALADCRKINQRYH